MICQARQLIIVFAAHILLAITVLHTRRVA
jgi:hypothetical protein